MRCWWLQLFTKLRTSLSTLVKKEAYVAKVKADLEEADMDDDGRLDLDELERVFVSLLTNKQGSVVGYSVRLSVH
jgi:selenocysteine lyase/cysteine desulfurase